MGADECRCSREAEIAQMHQDLKTIKRIVMGNGQPGLHETVIKLSAGMETLSQIMEDLKKAVNGLLRFQNECIGQEDGKDLIRRRNRWLIGLLATANAALIGGMITLIVKLV